jgi:uridylate kinase
MKDSPKYTRVVLKLSGEALCAPGGFGVDAQALTAAADRIVPILRHGVQMGLVVGAGNFVRGRQLQGTPIASTSADYMGMLGTVMNALALRDALQAAGAAAAVVSAIPMPLVCESFFRPRVMELLAAGQVVLFAGGTGHPGVTTDMCAALRAAEIGAQALLKATKVDGVFDSDPAVNPNAVKYDRLSYEQAVSERLGVMDLPAMAFCMERKIPIIVFNMYREGNLRAVVEGRDVGTRIAEGK